MSGTVHSVRPCAVPLKPRSLVQVTPVSRLAPAVPPIEMNGAVALNVGSVVGEVICRAAGPVGSGPDGTMPGTKFSMAVCSAVDIQAIALAGSAASCAAFNAASAFEASPAAKLPITTLPPAGTEKV